MSLIRFSEKAVRAHAEKIRNETERLAPCVRAGMLRNSVTDEHYIPIGRLTVSTHPPADPRPGDRWLDQATGEQHVFRATGGITAAEAGIRLKAALGGCPHSDPQPVILCTGEVVAAVCPACLVPLPPSYVGSAWRP